MNTRNSGCYSASYLVLLKMEEAVVLSIVVTYKYPLFIEASIPPAIDSGD